MASLDELRRELELARKALDLEKSIMAKGGGDPTRGEAMLRGLRQGITFGFGDEMEAAYHAGKAYLTTPGDTEQRKEAASTAYSASMTEDEARRRASSRLYPKTSMASEILGGAGLGGSTFGALNQVLRNAPMGARVAGIGLAEGAAYGAGTAQPGSRGEGAMLGGGLGMVGTPLILGAGTAISSILRPAARRLGEGLFGTPRDRAVREIMRALDADDINADEAIVLMRQMGQNATLADLGPTMQRAGRLVTSELGPASSQATRFLDARQRMGQMQLRQVARRATGSNNFDKGIVEIINNAESAAAPIYDEVFSEVIDVSRVMLDLLQRPAMKSARRKAELILKNEGFSDQIINDVTDVRYMDAVKRALDDQIGASVRSGNNNQARILTQLKNEFVSEIDRQIPRYAEARSVFAGEQAIREAADFGSNMLQGNKRLSDISETIRNMNESEIQAARAGFLDWLADELANQSVRSNRTTMKFTDVPKFRETINLLFPSKQAVDDFLNTASSLARFAETKNVVSGNSTTARIQADRAAATPGFLRVASDAALGPLGALSSALRLIRGNTTLSPEVLEEMGRILFDPNLGQSALQRNLLPRVMDIPKAAPIPATGVAGGVFGSQIDPILGLLGKR